MMINSISFCVIDHGASKHISGCISGIHSQNVPQYEILIYGSKAANELNHKRVLYLEELSAEKNNIGSIRNYLCSNAKFNHIVLIESEVELAADWYIKINQNLFYDIIGCRLIDTNKERVLDWAYKKTESEKKISYLPLRYDEWTAKGVITGFLILMGKKTWDGVRFSEDISSFGENSRDFCERASNVGYRIGVCDQAIGICWYTKSSLKKSEISTSQLKINRFKELIRAALHLIISLCPSHKR